MEFETKKRPLLIVAGPTAVGKTAVSVALAQKLNGECVSADSVQVYRGLDIGSAKVTEAEMQGVRHHLIDVIDPAVNYDVSLFQGMARDAIEDIYRRGKLPILVGGTGFYIQALLYGIDFSEEPDETQKEIRAALEKKAAEPDGPAALYEELLRVDPASTEKIHAHNVRRVIRALEYFRLHGSPISAHNAEERSRAPEYDAAFFVLTDERAKLYARIDRRVDEMLSQGLEEECRRLLALGLSPEHTSLQGIGYKEMLSHLRGECTLEEAAELIKRHSRNYAKRQLTWFRREPAAQWVDISEFHYEKEEIAEWITTKCTEQWA